jgi:hypothetical protein
MMLLYNYFLKGDCAKTLQKHAQSHNHTPTHNLFCVCHSKADHFMTGAELVIQICNDGPKIMQPTVHLTDLLLKRARRPTPETS